jgi:hypothetical protein
MSHPMGHETGMGFGKGNGRLAGRPDQSFSSKKTAYLPESEAIGRMG